MSAPVLTLRIDATGTAFGAAPTWTTYTSSLMARSFTTTWGRGDEQAEPTPRTASFELSNADGAWTPGHASAPANWDVGARVNVRLLANAVTTDRFDGYVDSIKPTWPGGVQSWSVVKVTCTDVSARLAISQPLRSMVEQEMLADSPTYLYPLSEAEGSSGAGDISGNSHAAAIPRASKYGAGTITFGTETTIMDGATGVLIDSPGAGAGGTVAQSVLEIARNSSGPFVPQYSGSATTHTVECWFKTSTTAPGSAYTLTGQASGSSTAPDVSLYVLGSGALGYSVRGTDFVSAVASGGSVLDGLWHHAVGTLGTDGRTARLYLDGVLLDTDVAASVVLIQGLTLNMVGGYRNPNSSNAYWEGLDGAVALVATYPSALSAARVLAHYQAGVGTLTERSDLRYARLAAYADVTTTGLPVGQATMGHQDTAGKSITEALATVARSEGSVSFVTGAGELTFHARSVRYNAVTGLTLTGDDIGGDTEISRDRQGFANEFTVTRHGGAAQRALDTASQTAKGRFDGGSLEVACSTDDDALQQASWQVAVRKQPQTRLSQVTVNLLAQPTAATVASVLAATVGTLLTVTGLPSQSASSSMSVFIEGATETIGVDQWSITFFTSPNIPYTTLRADAAPSAYTPLDAGLRIGF